MKAILLAAGLGTRLRPITETTPKCLVPIGGIPLLETWLRKLIEAGVGPCLINSHYLAETVSKFIDESIFKELVQIEYEPILLGTAGTLLNNIDFYQDEDGILMHADNYCNEDLRPFIESHRRRPKNCLMTMMTFRTSDPSNSGIVKVNSQNVAIEFFEKSKDLHGNLANGAIYIISPEMIKILKTEFIDASDFSLDILPYFMGKIFTHEIKGTLIDIGSPENYLLAQKMQENESQDKC